MIPRPSFAVKCVCTNCYLMGSSSGSKDNHETILFGSETISDLGEFIFCSVVVLGKGVRNIVIGSTKSLAVFSYFIER